MLREEIELLESELRRRERSRARERLALEERLRGLAEQASSDGRRADRLAREAAARDHEAAALRNELDRLSPKLHALEADLDRRKKLGRTQSEQLAGQAAMLDRLTTGITEVREDVERISASRSWRWGHGIVRSLDRLRRRRRITEGAVVRALGRLVMLEQEAAALQPGSVVSPGAGSPQRPRPGSQPKADASHLDPASLATLGARIRSRLGQPPKRRSWPRVSIIVLNRDGASHLRRLLAGLTAYTDYPNFELIVVDNGSSDDSREYLRGVSRSFELTVIENDDNVSFSDGNGQGAARADGELLLFLNNDIEPFERGWLRELVATAVVDGVGAAGATLLHGDRLAAGSPLVQHRGIAFQFRLGRLRPYNLGDGGELYGERFGRDVECPAVTGASLMMRRTLFEQLGGFPGGYRFGTEDVDLGLQIVARGERIICSGRSHLIHRESSTQNAQGNEFKRVNRLGNQQLFAERWSSALRREYRLGKLRGKRFWDEAPGPHVAITLTSIDPADGFGDWYTGHELGDALEQLGWRVDYLERKNDAWYVLPEGLDYVLVLLDAFDVRRVPNDVLTIAWVRNWTERWIGRDWFSRFDLVLASSAGSSQAIEEQAGFATVGFPLATNPQRFERVRARRELKADCVFTGNYWNQRREIQELNVHPGETFRVFGSGWEPESELAPYSQGPISYERLPAVYSSAKVVIDDTALHALPYGAVNSRVFDALACGTVVLTNCEAGVHELFDDRFPTWSDAASLRTELDRLLADEQGREAIARRYQGVVREQHTYAHRAQQLASVLEQAEGRLSFCIKTGANNRRVAPEWGDVHFGEALSRELRRRGHRTIVQVLDEWDEPDGLECDVVVHLKGLSPYLPKVGQFNILWCISHPDKLTIEECNAYDLVCVASTRFASQLKSRVKTPVHVLEQATDPRVFYPETDPRYEHELVFAANSRKMMRRIMSDLLPTDRDLAVYGTNWRQLIDSRYIAGEHVPNEELHKVYSSSAIVLNDHWDDMREHGFVSNRIYDALACGALVLSDDLPELGARFGDAVVTYSDRGELAELIGRLLSSPGERSERGRRGRETVLREYTFAHRVDQLLEILTAAGCEPHRVNPARRETSPERLRRWPRLRAGGVFSRPKGVGGPSRSPSSPRGADGGAAPRRR